MSGDLLNYMKRENEIVNHINLSLSLVTVQLRGQNWHWRGPNDLRLCAGPEGRTQISASRQFEIDLR